MKNIIKMRNINRNYFCGGDLVSTLSQTLCNPWAVACQAPLSMGLPRQEYWEVSSVSCIASRLFTH